MLVLTRKVDETIIVDLRPLIAEAGRAAKAGEDVSAACLKFLDGEPRIAVTVVERGSVNIRLGVDAARAVPVHRAEVADAIEAGKHQ